ncbi:peptidase C39 [Bacillus sp. HMF5848]|uniref:C39 family peptidase n=1 Tax=Bacillus sp. HMF5848 TaxID=2495421 RepID=UPI000F79DBEC|nr:C39 family peptidase [Bacillus sp. HMF5848]RSK29102.1 peptidase C39 [Bacillus sp. HMF5848]
MIVPLLLSAFMFLVITLSLYKKIINQRYRKIAHSYNVLFFGLFMFLFIYESNFLNYDNKVASSHTLNEDSEITAAAPIVVEKDEAPILTEEIKAEVLLDAPVIPQYPELPRGCEVTSLAMLLNYAGVSVSKMVLAEEVAKDPTPYMKKDSSVHFGDPHTGFVGNMYDLSKPGYGVYYEPILQLANKYLPNVVNLTNKSYADIQLYVSNDYPVWVVTNTTYKELPAQAFETWQTPSGPINITYKMHAVLITGYNEDYIIFNDPLTGMKNKKAPIGDFLKAWTQMGSQAITYVSE